MGLDAILKFQTDAPLTKEQLQKLSYKLAGDIGREYFWIHDYPDCNPMIELDEYNLYNIPLTCRYYGTGYERGPILIICGIAEWLENCIDNLADIFYGNDSSDKLEQFNSEQRDIIKNHFYKVGHLPYLEAFSHGTQLVTVCPRCNEHPIINMWGGGTVGGHCYGCNNQVTIKPNTTAIWFTRKR